MRKVLAASLLLAACAGTNHFARPGEIEHTDPARYPDDGAVIQERKFELRVQLNQYSERHYTRYAVVRSSGTSVAKVEVLIPPLAKLAYLRARATGPRGDAHDLAPKDIFRGTETRATGLATSWARAQVPSVEVGSVVEIDYELEYEDRLLTDDDRPLDDVFPIEHEQVSMFVDKATSSKMVLYQISAPITQTNGVDNNVARVELRDVPAYRVELFALPERHVRPRVGFHLSAAKGKAKGLTWSLKLEHAAHTFYALPTLPSNLVPLPSGQEDVSAYVARATAFVADKTDLASVVYEERARPLPKVLESRIATSTEKAELLRELLSIGHVVSHFAVVGHLRGDLDPDSPQIARFGHLLVIVPAQPGIDALTAIDPSCEACAVGELPSWTRRATDAPVDAIEFWTEGAAVRTEKLRLEGGSVRPESITRKWELSLDAQGTASVDLSLEEHGEAAMRQATQLRTLDAQRRKSVTTLVVTEALPGAKDILVRPPTYEKRLGRLRLSARARVAGYATLAGDRMIVPLSVLPSRAAARSNRERTSVVSIAHDASTRDVFTLHVPAGWSVEELPAPRTHTSTGIQTSVEASSEGETVTVRSSVDLTAGDYPPSVYAPIMQAIEDGAALHGESIVLTRK